jgi:phosphoribosylformylglycinamidine synthase II
MAIQTLYVARRDDPEALALLARLQQNGYKALQGLSIERVYRLEGACDLDKLLPLFANPVFETWSQKSSLDPLDGAIVEVGYRKAVIDPETASILDGARALRQKDVLWARAGLRYQFKGLCEEEAKKLAKHNVFSSVVQRLIDGRVQWSSLRPLGEPDQVRHITLQGLEDNELTELSEENSWYAPLSQLKALQDYEKQLGRPFCDAEIEVVVQSWSDHCYHTTWKGLGLLKLLKSATLEIDHPLIVSIFSDNAGGMEFYDGWVITIKGETHNFPSSIAPFAGVATKHGGVIRDTIGFGKGGYPIGGSTVMGTMDPRIPQDQVPSGALHPKHILRESIRATAYYCNPMGIPMMYCAYKAHPGYPKCLALGHSIGIIPREYAIKDIPESGDAVLLFGGRTGRDGLHGATASSAGMGGGGITKESAAVPIGHPMTEREFMEAVPVLRDRGCIRAITDLGAGGISSAAGEMGAETGVHLDLDAVPLKDPSLTAWEILLSESQERMLAAIPKDKLDEARVILAQYGVMNAVIGEFTESGRFAARWKGQQVLDISMEFLWGACPIDTIPIQEDALNTTSASISPPNSLDELGELAKAVLGHYNCCDQSPAGFQFDSTAQGRTFIGPFSGITGKMPTNVYVSTPIHGKDYGVLTTMSYNPFYGDVSPEQLVRLAMIEAVNRAVAVGADPREIALCDNFYTPKSTPTVAYHLRRMVEEAAKLSIGLGMPFISGKDSSSGTFTTDDNQTIDVPYTFVVSTLCRVPDVDRLVTKPFKKAGSNIVLVGELDPEALGGSVYLDVYGQRGNRLPESGDSMVDDLLSFWRRLNKVYALEDNPVKSAAAVGEGGLFLRLFEMCYGSGLGVCINLDDISSGRLDGILFAEAVGCMILEMSAETDPCQVFPGCKARIIGEVTDDPGIRLCGDGKEVVLDLDELTSVWEAPFKEVL